jgi:FKBP-type peptidyl-prolyl cis-trans isomerase (trigger factor)
MSLDAPINNIQQSNQNVGLTNSFLDFKVIEKSPSLLQATIIVSANVVDILYQEAVLNQQQHIQTQGFQRGNVPLSYIQENFKTQLISHLKEFIFKYCVINFLYKKIYEQKIVTADEPRLINITLEPKKDAQFNFEWTQIDPITIHEWKYFPFKAPKRKNYKDLDRQVETFIKEERNYLKNWQDKGLAIGDWVNFTITLANKDNTILLADLKQNFWFKLDNEEIEGPLRKLFLGKKKGDLFYTTNIGFQEYFSDQLPIPYNFYVEIIDIIPHYYFCLEQFKYHFRIKTNKDMHKKLIEVCSYRNDISQRLAMVEESLKLLLYKHPIIAPKQLVSRQQNIILRTVRENPDYNVYRKQKDFQKQVQRLAEKQIKEIIFLDQLAYHENIDATDEDIKNYLNLTKRQRMKEFIYYKLPHFKHDGNTVPIPTQELKQICLRDKTLNYIIYHLTKK